VNGYNGAIWIIRTLAESLNHNSCLPNRMCCAVAGGPPILGGFVPIPAAFAAVAERLTETGTRDFTPAALGRVARLNALGWL